MHLSRIFTVESSRDVTSATGDVDQRHRVEGALVDIRSPNGTAAARRNGVAGKFARKAFGEWGLVEEQLVETIVVAGTDSSARAWRDDVTVASTAGNV